MMMVLSLDVPAANIVNNRECFDNKSNNVLARFVLHQLKFINTTQNDGYVIKRMVYNVSFDPMSSRLS